MAAFDQKRGVFLWPAHVVLSFQSVAQELIQSLRRAERNPGSRPATTKNIFIAAIFQRVVRQSGATPPAAVTGIQRSAGKRNGDAPRNSFGATPITVHGLAVDPQSLSDRKGPCRAIVPRRWLTTTTGICSRPSWLYG